MQTVFIVTDNWTWQDNDGDGGFHFFTSHNSGKVCSSCWSGHHLGCISRGYQMVQDYFILDMCVLHIPAVIPQGRHPPQINGWLPATTATSCTGT